MYIENANVYVTFFKDEDKRNTDNVVYGNLSVSIKVDSVDGADTYENDYYKAYFVGKCYQQALGLCNKQRIKLNKMRIRNRYVKEKGKNYVSITVFSFDVIGREENRNEETQ